MAGAKSPQLQTEAEMVKAIREVGRVPVQRNTFYEPVKEWPASEGVAGSGEARKNLASSVVFA
jgi:aminodeoxyfutalosine synthase